jgi:membrane protein YdbS with pleckstrin-like domain
MKHVRAFRFLPDARYRHFHPVYLIKFIQKFLVLYLLPLVRALFLWDLDALAAALRQGAALLALITLFAALEWRASGWFVDEENVLHIRQGILFRRHLFIRGEELSAVRTDRSLYLRLLGAGQLTLFYARVRRPGTVVLYLPRRDCRALSDRLLPVNAPPFYRPLGAERLSLLILSVNAVTTALFLYIAIRQTKAFGLWADEVALAGLNEAAATAATWLPIGAAWLLVLAGTLLAISVGRSFFHTARYRVYKTDEAVLSCGGILHISECRVRLACVTACDIRATPAARLLHCYPVYLLAGAYTGGELPVLLYRRGHEEILAQLLPGIALPSEGLRPLKGRSLIAFLTVSGPLMGLFLLTSILSARILPDLAPMFYLAFAFSLLMGAVDLDGRRKECVLRTGARLTARVVRFYTLHTYCFFPCGAVFSFLQSPWSCAVRRGNLVIHLPAGTKVKIKSIRESEAVHALGTGDANI